MKGNSEPLQPPPSLQSRFVTNSGSILEVEVRLRASQTSQTSQLVISSDVSASARQHQLVKSTSTSVTSYSRVLWGTTRRVTPMLVSYFRQTLIDLCGK